MTPILLLSPLLEGYKILADDVFANLRYALQYHANDADADKPQYAGEQYLEGGVPTSSSTSDVLVHRIV